MFRLWGPSDSLAAGPRGETRGNVGAGMLELVEATSFLKELGSGRTLPVLVRAERENGDSIDVVAKLSAGECGLGGLVREAFAAMLAADLGLPIPEPVLVDFPAGFADIVPPQYASAKVRIEQSISPTFGSLYIPGGHTYPVDRPPPPELIEELGEIAAFDGVCRNPDRWAKKPNCLIDGRKGLFMIDHELALIDDPMVGVLAPHPWQLNGMETLITSPQPHILLAAVKGKGVKLERLEAAWGLLTKERLHEYATALPTGWDPAQQYVGPIVASLETLLDHTQELFAEARRILS